MPDSNDAVLERIAADIVIAFLASRDVEASELPGLVLQVRAALGDNRVTFESNPAGRAVEGPVAISAAAQGGLLTPAVPVDQSVTPDYLVSLEDGRKYKSLKRHLMAKHGLTPEQYRTKWGLPDDDPMVAPNYAKQRSDVALRIGLGKSKPIKAPTPARGGLRTAGPKQSAGR